MHKVLVNRLGGLSLPRKSVVRLTDHPDMTLDVYHGCKTTNQQQQQQQQQQSFTSCLILDIGVICQRSKNYSTKVVSFGKMLAKPQRCSYLPELLLQCIECRTLDKKEYLMIIFVNSA